MADHLLLFKTALNTQCSILLLSDQRQTSEASIAALTQNMALMTGGQQILHQEVGHLKTDIVRSLEFPEQQMRGGGSVEGGVY